jgi:hypothetical protein
LTDPGVIIIGMAGLAIGLTTSLELLRASRYDGKLEKLSERLAAWLKETDDELTTAIKTNPTIERVVEIASKFSSVKSKQVRLEALQDENSQSIQRSIVVSVGVILAALGALYALDSLAVDFGVAVAAIAWGANTYSAYNFVGECNTLEGKARHRKM